MLKDLTLNGSVCSFGSLCFADCIRLGKVKMDASVLNIAEDAFKNCEQLIINADSNSYAEHYAKDHHISTSFFDSDRFYYLIVFGGVALCAIGLFIYNVRYKKRRRDLQTNGEIEKQDKPDTDHADDPDDAGSNVGNDENIS